MSQEHLTKNDTFLHRKRISPRKLFLAQGKVFPRAVFNPPRVGLYIPSEARAVIETQGGLKTARGYTFVWPRSNFQGEILLWSRMVLSFILAGIRTASECLEQPSKAKKYPQKCVRKCVRKWTSPEKNFPREGKCVFLSLGMRKCVFLSLGKFFSWHFLGVFCMKRAGVGVPCVFSTKKCFS